MSTNNVIRLDLGEGATLDLPCPSFDELTLGEYIRLTDASDNEQPHETVARVFGIGMDRVMFLTMDEVERLLDFHRRWIGQGSKVFDRIKAVTEELRTMTDNGVAWTREDALEKLAAIHPRPEWFEIGGIRYAVPDNVDRSTVYGQYLDLKQVMGGPVTNEVAIYPRVLAVMCLPPGEQFHPDRNADRERVMMGVPFVDALVVCAFFFSTSQRFSAMLNHNFPNLLAWRRLLSEPGPLTSAPVGAYSGN